MPSLFGWIDSSEAHRRQMLDAIDLFREQDTRDELGIAPIRDGFADLLFPGTGALQTRARYFLFIPWMYLWLEKRHVPAREVPHKARNAEVALIEVLVKCADPRGTIGERARASLKRLPSNVYWHGLGAWGIRQFNGSQGSYHASLDRLFRDAPPETGGDDGSDRAARQRRWHAGMPDSPEGFPGEANFALRREEAEYLRDRIRDRASRSLLAVLVERPDPGAGAEFPWDLPLSAPNLETIREQIRHARNFSEVMHGAALLYNFMLAQSQVLQVKIEEYGRAIETWRGHLASREAELNAWDRGTMWAILGAESVHVPIRTREFVENWIGLALDARRRKSVADDAGARSLITERERHLKGALARLENPRALELWGGASGARQLAYRWPIALRLLTDIAAGLATR